MTDGELERFRLGDPDLFKRLSAEHSPRLLGAAMQLTRDRMAAHDLVHDTWVQAFHARASYRRTGSMLGWLLALMRTTRKSAVRTELRQHARAAAYVAERDALHDEHDSVEGALDVENRKAMLLDAVARLPERQRDVLVSRVLEEHSVAETASRLGMAEGTVKATLSQATRRLREILGGGNDE